MMVLGDTIPDSERTEGLIMVAQPAADELCKTNITPQAYHRAGIILVTEAATLSLGMETDLVAYANTHLTEPFGEWYKYVESASLTENLLVTIKSTSTPWKINEQLIQVSRNIVPVLYKTFPLCLVLVHV